MQCNHDNPPPYPNWIWSCSKCGQQFTNKLNTQEDKPMKPLSQTRQAIVEEFEKKANFVDERLTREAISFLSDYVSNALNDYTEEIVRMVEGMKDWDEPPPKPGYEDSDDPEQQYQCGLYDGYDRVLAELNK